MVPKEFGSFELLVMQGGLPVDLGSNGLGYRLLGWLDIVEKMYIVIPPGSSHLSIPTVSISLPTYVLFPDYSHSRGL